MVSSKTETLRILLVDDEKLAQIIGKMILTEKFFCTVDLATTGKQALILVDKKHHDIVFIDLTLPDIDGGVVTTKLRKRQDAKKDTQIVAITAHVINKKITEFCAKNKLCFIQTTHNRVMQNGV